MSGPDCLVARRATSASAANTLDLFGILHIRSRYSADACAVEVGLLRLDASKAAKLLVALLLPLGDQHRVRISVLQQPIVQLLADGLLLVVQLVDVAAALVSDLEYLPLRLVFGSC